LDALDDAELRDAVAGGDGLGLGCEVSEDDLELASIAGVDDTGECGDAADSQAGTVFYQSAVSAGQLDRYSGADGLRGAFLTDRSERCGFGGEEIGGEVAEGASVSVAGKLGGGVEALHTDRWEVAVVCHWVIWAMFGLWLSVACWGYHPCGCLGSKRFRMWGSGERDIS
jgi:hypothetical protein